MDRGGRIHPKKANRIIFPAAEPEYRAARQRCAEACANYNGQAEFASPERRARLWNQIVAKQVKESSADRAANEAQVKNQSTGHKENGKAHARFAFEATKPALADGPAAGEPALPHSLDVSQASQQAQLVSTSQEARPAVTPPPSPELKDIPSSPINGEHSVDECAIADTPPPSRKASQSELVDAKVNHAPHGNGKEHNPAITNPFIVRAPYVKPPVHIDYGTNLNIGASTFINRNFVVIDSPVCAIRIGERCLFGPNVILAAVEHPLGFLRTHVHTSPPKKANECGYVDADERISPIGAPSIASSIDIGDECWIAAGVKILCGVKIGSGCVIGPGSVVTKNIPDGSLAYGNPARVVRNVSPRYQQHSWTSADATDIADSAELKSLGHAPEAVDQSTPNDSCGSPCAAHACSSKAAVAYTSIQLCKDLTLLLLGVVSLVHWMKG